MAAVSIMAGLASMQVDASVTVQGWWHYGELVDYYADSSPNARRFGSAFSRVGSGNAGAAIVPMGVGGPLNGTGFISTNSLYWTPTKADAAGMWAPGATATTPAYNPPAVNYGIEAWALPEYPGTRGGNGAWLLSSGESGGVRLQLTNDVGEGTMAITARHIGAGSRIIGDPFVITTNRWVHLAIVVADDGTRFFVNGVQHGPTDTGSATVPAGNIFGGSAPGTQPTYAGFLDELRIFTFAAGQFSTNDLLLRPAGPFILKQPSSTTVWAGGAAPLTVTPVFDTSTTYQWRRSGVSIPGATSATYVLAPAAVQDSGASFDAVVTLGGLSVTSSVATVTVVAPNATDIAAYRDAINAEASLTGYYPIDGDTGTVITNVKDPAANGAIEQTVYFDSRTNRVFGARGLLFQGNGVVQIPSTPAFEFPSGNGTIESVFYMESGAITEPTILSVGHDFGGGTYYALLASRDGASLIYSNDVAGRITWAVPQSLVGRRTHLAVVFQNGTDITAYADGQPLGAQSQSSFGMGASGPLWIGGTGANTPDNRWVGSIDELSFYSAALPTATIQTHYSKYLYGTNTAAPGIVSQPTGPRDVLAGAAPVLSVQASGTLPLSYQWTANDAPIAGATGPTLKVSGGAGGTSVSYVLKVTNPFGTTSTTPVVLNFLPVTGVYAQKVMADGPSSYWRLGEQPGASVAVDRAGFNDAVYGGNVVLGVNGAFASDNDTAARFIDGNAVAPHSASLNPSGPFSVEFWAKPDQSGATGRSVIGSQNRNVGRSGYVIYQGLNTPGDTGRWEAHVGDSAGVPLWIYSLTSPQAGIWYHVVLVYDGTNSGRIYVNGADDTDTVNSDLEGSILPNGGAPFEIASRFGGALKYPGTVDDVAFYNYALSPARILEHFKVQYVPAQVLSQPAGITNTEGSTITIQAEVAGLPNTYQWMKDGLPVQEFENADLTRHFPNGVTNAALTISQTLPSDSGMYRLVVSNPNGGATSTDARVLIVPNTTRPSVVMAQGLGLPTASGAKPYLVKLLFDRRMDTPSAMAPGNYTISGGVAVTNVFMGDNPATTVLGGDWRSVVLATTGLTPGQKYSVTATGVKDRTVTGNLVASTPAAFEAPVLTQGIAAWDYYFLGAGNSGDIYSLLLHQSYPEGALTNSYFTNFDSSAYTGGNLQNTFFGALGNNYGSSLWGWITPQVSGSYTFFLSSDDASQLYLSTDASPANAALIAEEFTCCHGFTEPDQGQPYTSAPQTLVAGQRYFIRAVHVEGGGGDFVKVAWRLAGNPTPAAELQPIPGSVLSSFAVEPAPRFTGAKLVAGKLTLTWTGSGVLEQSTDLSGWSPVPGNPGSGTQVDVTGPGKFYRLAR